MTSAPLAWRTPAALAPSVLALAVVAAMVTLPVPPEAGALAVVAAALLLAVSVWALVDVERFVLIAVLGAMILPAALVRPAGANVALADALLVVALGAWLVCAAARAAPAPWLRGNRLLAPTLLFTCATAVSLAWSVQPRDTVLATVQIVEIVVVLPIVFASLPRSLGAVRSGLLFFVGLTCVLATVTFASFLPRALSGDMTGQYLPGLHKNAIGSFLAAGLVLAYALWLGEARPRLRRLLGLAALVEFLGLFASVSRGSLAGAFVAIIAVSILLRRGRVLALGVTVVATVAFLLAIGLKVSTEVRGTGGYDSSLVRGYSFDNAVEKISDRPLLGTGAGTYRDFIPELDIGLMDPNNLFLLTWAELGLLGVAALVFLLSRFFRVFAAARRLPPAAAVPAVAAGGVTVSLLVHFQVDSTWTRGSASLAFAMMGVMVASGRLAPARAQAPTPAVGGAPRTTRAAPAKAAAGSDTTTPTGDAATADAATADAPTADAATEQPPSTATSDAAPASVPGPGPASPRVLHVVTSDAYAGIERHVIRLCRELRALGCAAELACPPSAGRLRAEARRADVPVHPPAGGRRRAWLAAVARQLAARPPDVIHLHDGRSAVAGALLGPLGRGLVVRTQHFTRPASVERAGWRREASLSLHRALNRQLDGYIAVSQSVADGARERREASGAEVVVIPPGIELPIEQALARARAARRDLAAPVVTFIGRLESEKRLDVLLHAAAQVLEQLPDCRFVIAGSGGAEAGWRALATQLGIEPAVTWMGEVADPAPVLERAHVYVNPSPAEGFGLATAEAMAFALPVVAVAAGGSAEIVEDGVSGMLVPGGDAAALAGAIVRLAGDRPYAERLGEAARARAAASYGAERTAQATLAFYRRLRREASS